MQITTEITSSKIPSDNPIHQRLLYAYHAAKNLLSGSVLEVGCGEGRGIDIISPSITHYTALDKNKELIQYLATQYPSYQFIDTIFPPFNKIADNSFDFVIAFQVIEHIENDNLFIKELYRVLKPGGKLIISTPNIALTLTRNPWHEREYTWNELNILLKKYFNTTDAKGITGDKTVWEYYELNKKSVQKITRWDILDLQHKLPAKLLRAPYDYLNRNNRQKMMNQDNSLVAKINLDNYNLSTNEAECFDLFFTAQK